MAKLGGIEAIISYHYCRIGDLVAYYFVNNHGGTIPPDTHNL